MARRAKRDADQPAFDDPWNVVFLGDLPNARDEIVQLLITSGRRWFRQHVQRGGKKGTDPLAVPPGGAAAQAKERARADRLRDDAIDHFHGDLVEQFRKSDPALRRGLIIHARLDRVT